MIFFLTLSINTHCTCQNIYPSFSNITEVISTLLKFHTFCTKPDESTPIKTNRNSPTPSSTLLPWLFLKFHPLSSVRLLNFDRCKVNQYHLSHRYLYSYQMSLKFHSFGPIQTPAEF